MEVSDQLGIANQRVFSKILNEGEHVAYSVALIKFNKR